MNWKENYLQQLMQIYPDTKEYHLLAVLDISKGLHIRNLRAALTCHMLAKAIEQYERKAKIFLFCPNSSTIESLQAERELKEWIPEVIWIDWEEVSELESWKNIISSQKNDIEKKIMDALSKCLIWKEFQIHLESVEKKPEYDKKQRRLEESCMKNTFNLKSPIQILNEAVLIKGNAVPNQIRTFPIYELCKIYEIEMIFSLYEKTEPSKSFEIPIQEGLLKQYFDYDKIHTQQVAFNLLVQLGSLVNFNVSAVKEIFEHIGICIPYAIWKTRLVKAKYWVDTYEPNSRNSFLEYRNWNVYENLTKEEKEEISALYKVISEDSITQEYLQLRLYEIPKNVYGEENENLKKLQTNFFQIVYQLLLGKDRGPKLPLLLGGLSKEKYSWLLDFHELITLEEEVWKDSISTEEEITNWIPEPIKSEITIEDFQKLDLRVCEIKGCMEIPKSHSNLRLVLDDGQKERIIISSIKKEYQPKELIGKKIVVIANLQPAKFTGVVSEGMLLAATHKDCGCKVLFVDESVPAGTRIS